MRNEKNKLNFIPEEFKFKIEQVLDSYRGLNNIADLSISKISAGLTNQLFVLSYKYTDNLLEDSDCQKEEKVFLKFFGDISQYNLIDREFETQLINVNSELGLCSKCLLTDYKTFRVEEYLEDMKEPEDSLLLIHNFKTNEKVQKKINDDIQNNEQFDMNNNFALKDDSQIFFEKLLDVLIQFEMSVQRINKEACTVDNFLNKIILIAKERVSKFELDYDNNLNNLNNVTSESIITKEKIDKIKYYVINSEEILHNLTKKIKYHNFDNNHHKTPTPAYSYILNHNDVHQHNLLLKQDKSSPYDYKLLLIDYEFACMNYIGFDIINYCIESFFNIAYPKYPFYKLKVEDVGVLYEEGEKYFVMYRMYLEKLIKYMQNKDNNTNTSHLTEMSNLLKEKEYFIRVSGVCSLFWFYSSLLSLDFNSILSKQSLNYLDYSIDRISIYEKAVSILDRDYCSK